MSFIPSQDSWLDSHYNTAPNKIRDAIGGVQGKRLLSVGCGEPLIEFGVLAQGASEVIGLDIVPENNTLSNTAIKLSQNGYHVPDGYQEHIKYVQYDGSVFPFEDDYFDGVYSWGVFEHVHGVNQVLREMKRVLKPGSWGMVSVFPWYPSFYGSHLSDYIDSPFFHHRESAEWVKSKLDEFSAANPEMKDLVSRHMWQEFNSLNKMSPEDFYKEVKDVGFSDHVWELLSYAQSLKDAPRDASLSDLMICGTTVRLLK